MSTYEPGTVAIATVRNTRNVRVMRSASAGSNLVWATSRPVEDAWWFRESEVTVVRPLVVLDMNETIGKSLLPMWIQNAAREIDDPHKVVVPSSIAKDLRWIADQIEAQTKPPRIPEPSLWGVVEATGAALPTRRWVHHEEGRWVCDTGAWRYWSDLTDPVLVRDGIEGAS